MPHYTFIRRHMVVSISRVRVPNPDRAEVPTKPVRESPPVTASGVVYVMIRGYLGV